MTIKRGEAGASGIGHAAGLALRGAFTGLCLAGALSACSSGGGGDGGQGGDGPNPGDVVGGGADPSVAFSYPVNGQDNVYVKSQIAVAYRGDVDGDPGLTLAVDGTPVDTNVERDSNQSNIFRLSVPGGGDVERAGLEPNTSYTVQNGAGDTLFSFTTRAYDGRPGEGAFSVARLSRIGDRNVPFTEFNPIRARFSSPVDEGSIELCDAGETLGTDCTVSVTGPDGAVPGRLTVLGSDMTFDPSSDLGDGTPSSRNAADYDSSDLVGGQTYTVAFDGVRSAFGDELSTSFKVTPVAISEGDSVDTVQALSITGGRGDNPLNGGLRNLVKINSQLIGGNDQPASNADDRGGLLTRLAGTTSGSRYNGTFPGLIPAGQQFDLTPLALKLNGDVDTPINTDNIRVRFANDADVYLVSNAPLAGIEAPTQVLLRFDLGISTAVPQGNPIAALSNGVFNQTAMDIVAAGLAVPQPNGDIKLTTLGSFPVSVNRTGNAIVDFELELTLPNPSASDMITVDADTTAPRITAQYPSGCLYTFNTQDAAGNPLFESGSVVGGIDGTTTLSDTEANCISVLSQREILNADDMEAPDALLNFPEPRADSLPLRSNPSLTFSEPVDPISLGANITLTNNADSSEVPVRLRSEGSSVVIDPVEALEPDTQYTVQVGQGITDLAGNGLEGNFPGSTLVSNITFNTEPMVIPREADGQPTDVSQDLTQRRAVRQAAPFLTVLTPGMPCPLMQSSDEPESDFRSGGDIAGRCVGDSATASGDFPTPNPFPDGTQYPAPSSAKVVYPVFKEPANNTVDAYFSKPVQASTIQMANGCLIGGSGNTNSDATVAVQIMDGSGQCTGVVPGALALLTPSDTLTRGFSFRPTDAFVPGQRYWIVVCGSADDTQGTGASDCSTGKTVLGQNGLRLNTNSLLGTGTRVSAFGGTQNGQPNPAPPGTCGAGITDIPSGGGNVYCYDDNRAQGGPDIVMPFDGAPATRDFYATTLALPETDTNGNGIFDNTPYGQDRIALGMNDIGGQLTDETTYAANQVFDDSFGRERSQPANIVFSATLQGLLPGAGAEAGFLSGGRPVAIRQLNDGESCAPANQVTFNDGTSVIGNSAPSQCLPVDLLPGGFTAITSLAAGNIAPTGRTLLRFPYGVDGNGQSTDKPQSGYIVPECQGSFQGEDYDYAPCFVANLRLTVNGNDGISSEGTNLAIPQQDLNVRVFGPVAFEQNGRLVISTKNANAFAIVAYLTTGPNFPPAPLPAPTQAGDQSLQLIGPAIHGGLSFPVR
ncbi:Ig-like domain-containing protein [Salinisphaera sp. T31B1]|uniref:Ig-like domain-containing protein n=1 Tax=Salinisphaera sp. T31B1 TaxID=727963 RepID=UPI00333F2CA4